MNLRLLSDMHGDLPTIRKKCDVVCICGDIMPLDIQRDYEKSIIWISSKFIPWCEKLPCDKVIFIAGNHDFVFDEMYIRFKKKYNFYEQGIDSDVSESFSKYVASTFGLFRLDKIKYLHNSSYEYKGVKFYGTPYIPELKNWAFYADSEELKAIFSHIPQNVDVLLTHSPGKNVNLSGTVLQSFYRPEYGSQELTDAVNERNVKYWFCGHVHTGNHNVTYYNGITVANVSIKDENYNVTFKPLSIEIEDGETVC